MKLVKEEITFVRHEDPHKALGIGTLDKINSWLEKYSNSIACVVENPKINDDLSIDADYANFIWNGLDNFPEYIQFNKIKGSFNIQRNNFTTLRGCPIYVGGDFGCSENELTSLDFCPKVVKGYFNCSENKVRFTKNDVISNCKCNIDAITV